MRRWPVILTSIIDSVYSENHELTGIPDKADKLEEGKTLIATISRLKYGMARDRELEYVLLSRSVTCSEGGTPLISFFSGPSRPTVKPSWTSTTPSFPDSKQTARTLGSQPRGSTRSMTFPHFASPLPFPPCRSRRSNMPHNRRCYL